jgi:hypothetical protein
MFWAFHHNRVKHEIQRGIRYVSMARKFFRCAWDGSKIAMDRADYIWSKSKFIKRLEILSGILLVSLPMALMFTSLSRRRPSYETGSSESGHQ